MAPESGFFLCSSWQFFLCVGCIVRKVLVCGSKLGHSKANFSFSQTEGWHDRGPPLVPAPQLVFHCFLCLGLLPISEAVTGPRNAGLWLALSRSQVPWSWDGLTPKA